MTFGEKLKKLRTDNRFTQDELAQQLYVTRTAISKWESGRGYPNIDSLKLIARLFSVSIDELLSSDELLTIAEEENKQNKVRFRDQFFGLLDLSTLILFFLPFFAQRVEGVIVEGTLLSLTEISLYLKIAYLALVIGIIAIGILTLALQNCDKKFWVENKGKISLLLNVAGILLFIISRQPYAPILLFVLLIIKTVILIKKR